MAIGHVLWPRLELAWKRLGVSKIDQESVLEQYPVRKMIGSMLVVHRINVTSPFLKDFGFSRLQNVPKIGSKSEQKRGCKSKRFRRPL